MSDDEIGGHLLTFSYTPTLRQFNIKIKYKFNIFTYIFTPLNLRLLGNKKRPAICWQGFIQSEMG
ncbi:hypothetical protein, partial [Vibrio parahaemolyticus]|uniref:hypothetical protein n=1 Tax=Vibrio parahaemolyticus TaxID=670 RepID=UPI001E401923